MVKFSFCVYRVERVRKNVIFFYFKGDREKWLDFFWGIVIVFYFGFIVFVLGKEILEELGVFFFI